MGEDWAMDGSFIESSVRHATCSEVKSHLGSHLLTPVTRLYTQYTHEHPKVNSSSTMGEVTDV
jgi:hypothetical protein